jgi:hypothetical protein
LFDASVGWLHDRRVLLPGASRPARLVGGTREAANQRLWDTLWGLLEPGPRVPEGLSPASSHRIRESVPLSVIRSFQCLLIVVAEHPCDGGR